MAGNVDDVVDAAKDAIVAVGREHGPVGGVIRPVAPIFAVGIGVVFLVVVVDKALRVAPDGLHDAGPRIADADVPGGVRFRIDLLAVLIPNYRIDAQAGGAGAAGLHRIQRRLGGAEEAAGFRLPPGVHNHGFALAHHFVIPAPDFGLDRFADRGHVLEAETVLFRLVGPRFAQHADGGG